MKVNQIYEATIVDSSSAWIYPVEPVNNREEYAKLVEDVRVWSHFAGTFARKVRAQANFIMHINCVCPI